MKHFCRELWLSSLLCVVGLISSPCGGQVLWSENFDSYAAGASLSSPWSVNGCGNANTEIDSSTSVSPPNSLRVYGAVGSCCGSLPYRTFGTNQNIEVDFYAKCGSEQLSGCHPDFVTVQLWDGVAAASDGRTLIRFQNDGNIYGGDWNTGQNSAGLVLGTYQTGVWYYCRIQYALQGGTNVVNNFWINNVFSGTTNYPPYSYESNLVNISFASNEGTTWYDNISVSSIQAASPPQPTLSIQKAVYLTAVNLLVGSNYQIQASMDLSNWTNQGQAFTATNSNWQSTNYWSVSDWNQLFFRLQSAP